MTYHAPASAKCSSGVFVMSAWLETAAASVSHALNAVHSEGVPNKATDSASMRRHVSDSIYLWACGEKADDGDEDPTLSDRLIGWLILLVSMYDDTNLTRKDDAITRRVSATVNAFFRIHREVSRRQYTCNYRDDGTRPC